MVKLNIKQLIELTEKQHRKKMLMWFGPLVIGFVIWFLYPQLTTIIECSLIIYYLTNIIYMSFDKFMNPPISDMNKAWRFACKYWKEFRQEDLSTIDGTGITNYYGEDKFVAFTISRTQRAIATKKYMDLVLIIKMKPLDCPYWKDSPTTEVMNDPWLLVSKTYHGSPSPLPLEAELAGKSFLPPSEPLSNRGLGSPGAEDMEKDLKDVIEEGEQN